MTKKVVITGGSKGLGLEIKERLEECNTHYVIGVDNNLKCHDLGKEKDENLSYEIINISRSTGYDLSTRNGIVKALQTMNEIKPDILICCAGAWEGNLTLNYEAPKIMLMDPNWKHAILILSNAAYRNYSNNDYTTAKAGLLMLARRLQDEGKAVTTISPGTIDTGFWDNAKVDNRLKGAMKPETVANLVYQSIIAKEEGCLIRELICTPFKNDSQ